MSGVRIWLVSFLTFLSQWADASLRVYPVAIELSKAEKSSQLTVTHDYTTERWVEISPQYFEMSADGQMIPLDEEKAVQAKRSAIRMLRFSPKRFLLKPGESQIVKLRSRIPAGKEDGVYRVHLKFTPDEAEPIEASEENSQSSFQLSARISIAVPVYITKGSIDVDFKLSDSKIVKTPEGWILETELKLSKGDMVRGNIFTYLLPPKQEKDLKFIENQDPLSKILGVATYTSIRKVRLSLGDSFDGLKPGHSLRVEFRSGDRLNSQLLSSDTVSQ